MSLITPHHDTPDGKDWSRLIAMRKPRKYNNLYDMEVGQEILIESDKVEIHKVRGILQNLRTRKNMKFKTHRVNAGNFYLIKRIK